MFDRALEFIVKKTGQVLHLPYMSLHYSLVQTLDGRVISDTGKRRAKSWNRNAYNSLMSFVSFSPYPGAFEAGSLALKNTAGSTVAFSDRVIRPDLNMFSGAQGITTSGILIGTNNTAETFEDFQMLGLIPEGQGTGQVNYGVTYSTKSYAGTTLTVKLLRYYNNNSNGNIDIGEIGLQRSSFLYARESFSPKETFHDKAQLKVAFEISLLYPS